MAFRSSQTISSAKASTMHRRQEQWINRTNPFNQGFDKGPADFDRTHVFNFSGLWELPGVANSNPLAWW